MGQQGRASPNEAQRVIGDPGPLGPWQGLNQLAACGFPDSPREEVPRRVRGVLEPPLGGP
eukprot:1925909-Alexandrium_andersonii.AAC.1